MYIGFGSLLVDNPKGLTKMILSAAKRTGQRIILCRSLQHVHCKPVTLDTPLHWFCIGINCCCFTFLQYMGHAG